MLAFFASAMYLFFFQSLNAATLLALCSPVLVAVIGFYDDHAHVAVRWRFLVHVLAALLALYFMQGLPWIGLSGPDDTLFAGYTFDLGWIGYSVGAVFLVWLLNLFNFMDGTDGIAASEAIFVSLGLAGGLYVLEEPLYKVSIGVAAASLGFLVWNWPKAKIFMGDVGSGFLGLLLGVLILMASQKAANLFYCGLILFGAFVVDATYTLGVRFVTGQKWYDAHCSHTYQYAAKRYGHKFVLLATWGINLLWLLPVSSWVFLHPNHALAGLLVAYVPLIVLAYCFKAGQARP